MPVQFTFNLSSSVPLLNPLQNRRNFREVFRRDKPIASKISVEGNKICFNPVKLNKHLEDIFVKTGEDSCLQSEFHRRPVTWNNVVRCLDKGSRFMIGNAKDNLCFNYKNIYLANAFFTFGKRYVMKGTRHIYQTSAVPIWIYIFPSPSTDKIRPDLAPKKKRVLDANNQLPYRLHLLKPNRAYVISGKKHYAIFTTQSTLFSVHVVMASTSLPFLKRHDPSQSKNWISKMEKENCGNFLQIISPSSVSSEEYMTYNIAQSPADCPTPFETHSCSYEDIVNPIKDLCVDSIDKKELVEAFNMMETDELDKILYDEAGSENVRAKMDAQQTVFVPSPADYAMPTSSENESEALSLNDIMDSVKVLITSPTDEQAFNLVFTDELDHFFLNT